MDGIITYIYCNLQCIDKGNLDSWINKRCMDCSMGNFISHVMSLFSSYIWILTKCAAHFSFIRYQTFVSYIQCENWAYSTIMRWSTQHHAQPKLNSSAIIFFNVFLCVLMKQNTSRLFRIKKFIHIIIVSIC